MPRVSGAFARLVGALLGCAVALPAIAADHIAMRFEVYGWMGMRVLTLRSEIDLSSNRYSVNVNYATSGIAGLLVEQSTQAFALGRFNAGSIHPVSFRSITRRDGVERHNRVDYLPDGTIDGNSTPAPDKPVPPEEIRGTMDNLSAYLQLERQLAATRSCSLTVPVFDGRHRYDLIFAGGQQQMLSPERGQNFEGGAVACHMKRRVRVVDESEQSEGAREGTLWYATLIPGADLMIPVRMRLRTQIGTVDAYLAEIHGRGVDLRLIE